MERRKISTAHAQYTNVLEEDLGSQFSASLKLAIEEITVENIDEVFN